MSSIRRAGWCRRAPAAARRAALAALVLSAMLGAGCAQKMAEQPHYRPLEASGFFAEGSSARDPIPGTVPRSAAVDPHLALGTIDGEAATSFPFEVTDEVIRRGAERFAIFCTPCHGPAGAGDGPVVQRGFPEPPALTIDRLSEAPVGELFGTISEGVGRMPPYGGFLSPEQRWAVVAFLRELQEAGRASAQRARTGGGG